MRLEELLNKSLLQLACRHHVSEVWGGAACTIVYGETTSPDESCFKAFCSSWKSIDTDRYSLPAVSGRFLKGLQASTVKFLTDFLQNTEGSRCTLRHDYLELAELALLLLGGTLTEGIKIRAPGATHHARWMAAMIYTFKLTLFRDQLTEEFEEESLDLIEELGIFLALVYVQYWRCCTSAADAPVQDLALLTLLETALSSNVSDLQGAC